MKIFIGFILLFLFYDIVRKGITDNDNIGDATTLLGFICFILDLVLLMHWLW